MSLQFHSNPLPHEKHGEHLAKQMKWVRLDDLEALQEQERARQQAREKKPFMIRLVDRRKAPAEQTEQSE